LGTARLLDTLTANVLHTNIVAGVGRLRLTNVDITYDCTCVVSSVFRRQYRRYRESRRIVAIVEAVVDDAASHAVVEVVVSRTRSVEPSEERRADVTATVQRHLRALRDRRVFRSTNQCRLHPCECEHVQKPVTVISGYHNFTL